MSKYYTAITGNNNGLPFPDTKAVNASGPTATDGTELVRQVMDDVWDAKQAELDFYNYPPNTLDNLPGIDGNGYPRSQPLLAKYLNYGTPGTVIALGWNAGTDPAVIAAATGCDVRLLFLNGQGINRTLDDYKLLDSLVYCGDTANPTADYFYHADDALGAVRNIAGDYLILPDTRGYFLRGLDSSGAVDPNRTGEIVGSAQDDALQNITGSFEIKHIRGAATYDLYLNPQGAFGKIANGGGTANAADEIGVSALNDVGTFDASGSPDARTSTETRPKNIAIRHAIYY